MIGRGHGQAYLRLLAARLCAECAPLVAIDPAEDNVRARRAYEKAGFRVEAIGCDGSGPSDPDAVRARAWEGQFAFGLVGLKRADNAQRREVGREHEREATPEQPAVGMSKAGRNGRLALAAA